MIVWTINDSQDQIPVAKRSKLTVWPGYELCGTSDVLTRQIGRRVGADSPPMRGYFSIGAKPYAIQNPSTSREQPARVSHTRRSTIHDAFKSS